MTVDEFRRLALALHGAVEGAHMGHPDFRANGRIFASLLPDKHLGTVMITPEEQAELMKESPATFFPCSGAWGRAGSTHVRLNDAADEATVRAALTLAFERAVSKPAPRVRGGSRTTTRPRAQRSRSKKKT